MNLPYINNALRVANRVSDNADAIPEAVTCQGFCNSRKLRHLPLHPLSEFTGRFPGRSQHRSSSGGYGSSHHTVSTIKDLWRYHDLGDSEDQTYVVECRHVGPGQSTSSPILYRLLSSFSLVFVLAYLSLTPSFLYRPFPHSPRA